MGVSAAPPRGGNGGRGDVPRDLARPAWCPAAAWTPQRRAPQRRRGSAPRGGTARRACGGARWPAALPQHGRSSRIDAAPHAGRWAPGQACRVWTERQTRMAFVWCSPTLTAAPAVSARRTPSTARPVRGAIRCHAERPADGQVAANACTRREAGSMAAAAAAAAAMGAMVITPASPALAAGYVGRPWLSLSHVDWPPRVTAASRRCTGAGAGDTVRPESPKRPAHRSMGAQPPPLHSASHMPRRLQRKLRPTSTWVEADIDARGGLLSRLELTGAPNSGQMESG